MKIKGNEACMISNNGYLAVTYSPFDFGNRYKLYRKISYIQDGNVPEEFYDVWTYVTSFQSFTAARQYMENAPDVKTIR